MIPTTSGTGSEVTMVAVVSDTEKNVKMPFASYYLMPHAAILDPRMTQTLPPHLTAMTAMDAMTHAVEAYTCMAANPISDAYATAAVKRSVPTYLMCWITLPMHKAVWSWHRHRPWRELHFPTRWLALCIHWGTHWVQWYTCRMVYA